MVYRLTYPKYIKNDQKRTSGGNGHIFAEHFLIICNKYDGPVY